MSIQLGTTIYSMTNEWLGGNFTLSTLLDEVGRRNIGPGVEVIGFQSFRGFPNINKEDKKSFLDAIERNELSLTSLGSNADVALNANAWMDTEKSVEYMRPQIELASRLGFPVVRIQIGLTPEVLEKLEPIAAKANVKLGMEIHAPEGPNTVKVMATREAYDHIDSEYLGFIPDFSSTMRDIPPDMIKKLQDVGLSEDGVTALRYHWESNGAPFQRYMAFNEAAKAAGEPELPISQARLIFTMFGREKPEDWADILDKTFHIHGKFYEVAKDFSNTPSVDYERILGIYANTDRTISMSSEWEGHAFFDAEEQSAFDIVQQHHQMCRNVLNKIHASQTTRNLA